VSDYGDLLRIATAAAGRGAEFVRSVARPTDPVDWGLKGVSDFVTRVDREAEALIAEALSEGVPGSVVLGEELSPQAVGAADLLWVVDPLDGTTNYLHEYPAYGVSVGAVAHGTLAAGVVVDVARGITYHATAGGGAWAGEHRLEVSRVTDPSLALIGTGFPFKVLNLLPRYLRQFTAILQQTSGIRRGGAASLDFVDLAQGRFDGFWELHLAPWDVAAGALILREAGGVVTGLDGEEEVVRHGAFVAGNPAIHAWLLSLLRE
jgi:myo-inositol-1(or 4)-monophosphatase